ncbi:MAG: ABC transporter permease, partial [Prevotellaceae bacterium]|nr:ABC transporter permease [Prevotellaceae bacterium]
DSNNPGAMRFSGIENRNREKSFVDLSANPGVEKHSLFRHYGGEDIVVENQTYSSKVLVTDTCFLQILDYRVIAGVNNLRRPEDVIITDAFAAKVFGSEDPLGKTISYPSLHRTFTVAGIIRTPAYKSILSFDMIVSSQLTEHWSRIANSVILLYPGVDYRNFNRQYSEFMEMTAWGYGIRFQLFPYGDIYFEKHIANFVGFAHGNLTYIFILSGIGILLLLTGLVNYINIHSTVMTRRNRELGMKKVFGAEGYRIFIQLLIENLTVIGLSLIIAFRLAAAFSPFMENRIGVMQYPNLRFDLWLSLAFVAALPILVSIVPFLRYRYFSPIRSLQSVNAGNRSLFSRKFFLCFQYCLTVGLITVSLFFVKQLNFMLDKDLGFRTHDVISVPFIKDPHTTYEILVSMEERDREDSRRKEVFEILKQKLNASTEIEHWTFGGFPIGAGKCPFKVPDGELQVIGIREADEKWFKVFEIELLEGRLWDNETDEWGSYNLIASESVLKQFGITDYREGELIPYDRLWWSSLKSKEEMDTNPPYHIVGVVKDFHTEHLSAQLTPTVFTFSNPHSGDTGGRSVIASFAPERRKEVVEFMKSLHEELIGGEFSYTFIEDDIARIYSEDKKVTVICTAFTGMAILISILGLLGVSLFDIRQRRKEIALRKINGAMMKDVVSLLLKRYFALLGVAFAISVPVTLFVIVKYLENFAYKAPISWWLFAVALAVTVVISLLTLTYQVYKAGTEPPIIMISD